MVTGESNGLSCLCMLDGLLIWMSEFNDALKWWSKNHEKHKFRMRGLYVCKAACWIHAGCFMFSLAMIRVAGLAEDSDSERFFSSRKLHWKRLRSQDLVWKKWSLKKKKDAVVLTEEPVYLHFIASSCVKSSAASAEARWDLKQPARSFVQQRPSAAFKLTFLKYEHYSP